MLIKWRKLGLRHREYTARVVYLLLLAIPFAALALLSLFAFLSVLAVRWIVSLAGAARYLAKRRSDWHEACRGSVQFGNGLMTTGRSLQMAGIRQELAEG
jgi:hypothetical protein